MRSLRHQWAVVKPDLHRTLHRYQYLAAAVVRLFPRAMLVLALLNDLRTERVRLPGTLHIASTSVLVDGSTR